jgi:hypothetical protein
VKMVSMVFGTYLADHTLGDLAGVKGVIETETTNMGVSTDTFDSCQVFDFLDFGVDS